MIIKPIRLAIWDFMVLRNLRNQCRLFMTSYQQEISFMEQMRFYRRYSRSADMMVFLGYKNGKGIAYGLVSNRGDDRWWVSGGVHQDHRGQGYGRQMFEKLTEQAKFQGQDAWLDVLASNRTAIALYKSLGYEEVQDHISAHGPALIMSNSE